VGERTLNVAATCVATTALGPGVRAVVWVQGCPFRCTGCIAPEWIPDVAAERLTPHALADRLLVDPKVAGVTFSGGEPMQQAAGLADTIAVVRRARDVSLICYTGYRIERLRRRPPTPGVPRLLAAIDVLIDGQYVQDRDDDRGLRGSANQRVHHLTDRLRGYDFTSGARTIEIQLMSDSIQVVGLPTRAATAALDRVMPRPSATSSGRSAR
jgi:anaerobic ribonucleoside-triphosphate reductase activating protein